MKYEIICTSSTSYDIMFETFLTLASGIYHRRRSTSWILCLHANRKT